MKTPGPALAFDRASVRRYDDDGRLHVDRSGIYAITTPSGSQYVGSSIHFAKRWARHLTYLRSGNHHNAPLQRAFAKYGEDGLKFSIILICLPEHLLEYEQRAIDVLNPKYNVCRIAGSQLGIKRSAETVVRMSEAQSRREPPSEETRRKIGAAKTGLVASDESKAKASASLKAYYSNPASREASRLRNQETNSRPETRAKISAALVGVKKTPETRAKMSEAQKGHPSTTKGIPRSAEVKAKISATKRANAERKKNESLE